FGAELSGYCTGCATGDVDNDGDPDLYVANYINGNSNLFLNISEKKSFVKITLHGVRSNKDAIGAKVWLYKSVSNSTKGVLAGYRELNGGSGYASVSAKEMIFGVEKGSNYFALIKFPSSKDTLRLNKLVAGDVMEINELEGLSAFLYESKNRLIHFFINQENQPEIIKYILIILLLVTYNLKLFKNKLKNVINTWLATGFIFAVFVFSNQFLLFQWPTLAYFTSPLIVLSLLIMFHLFISRILMRRLAQKEKQELREKLSRDLHDDLASTLGSISIYAETLKGMNEPEKYDFKKLSAKIAGLNQSALQSISDIIWMTSPRNDSLQSLVSKTSNYMFETLTDNNINFSSTLDIPDTPILLKEKIRNDSFLIMKEGLHNIIRHSGAKNVAFKAELINNNCTISLKDDGVGMHSNSTIKKGSHGNGLVNMRRRAQESGIDFSILPTPNSGVEIRLHFKI
ncbi:MAG: sensor histidine kinase, partial [Bacteroidales bacterium]